MTQREASSFFENYAEAFDNFDAQAIAKLFDLPSMIVTPGGSSAYTSENQLISNFEQLNALHISSGYQKAELFSCNVEQNWGKFLSLVATTWKIHREKKSQNSEVRMNYLLRNSNTSWKISSAINLE